MSMFIFVFDGIMAANRAFQVKVHDMDTLQSSVQQRKPERIRIFGMERFSTILKNTVIFLTPVLAIWPAFVLIEKISGGYIVGNVAIPFIFWGIIYGFLYSENAHHISHRKNMLFWIMYVFTIPFVATAFFMLLQRRDRVLNWSLFFITAAAGLGSFAIEIVQRSYEYAVQNGLKEYGFCRKKNMVIKIVMLCQCLIAGMLVLSALPVFPATNFSNSYQTIVIVFAITAVPFALCGRYLTDVSSISLIVDPFSSSRLALTLLPFSLQADIDIIPSKLDSDERKWDLWPLDPVTLEMFGRFMFTIAFLGDVWSMELDDNTPLYL